MIKGKHKKLTKRGLGFMFNNKKGSLLSFFLSFLLTSATIANPEGGVVTQGTATIQSGPTTTINQTSQRAVINWQSFNIGAQEATHFNQPAGGIALNRISPTQGASQI